MVIGLACRVDDDQPHVGIVHLDRVDGQLQATAYPLRPSRHHDRSQQLLNLAADLETHLADLSPAAIVVRTVERWGGRQRVPRDPSTRLRLWVEGVLLATARRHLEHEVAPLTGQEIGHACRSNKDAVTAEAATLVDRHRPEFVDACAAALAALANVERAR
jgi:hypothetical protein